MKKRKILYLGLNLPPEKPDIEWVHYPVIKIVPRRPNEKDIQFAFERLVTFSHILFTSKSTVQIFNSYLSYFKKSRQALQNIQFISIGKSTASEMLKHSFQPTFIAEQETSEGIIQILQRQDLGKADFFLAAFCTFKAYYPRFLPRVWNSLP